ncbi:hypothetical protein [Salmonella enterica]|uniref:hypothetical protein n=1 Tax=Salmonella enterica TaxID=28901 RepID=UPI0023DCF147|nr:hypothetical protein [Salmonella enterica]
MSLEFLVIFLKTQLVFFGDVYYPLLEGVVNLFFSALTAFLYWSSGIIIGTIISNVLITLIAKPLYLYGKMFGRFNALKKVLVICTETFNILICYFCCFYFTREQIIFFKVSNWFDFISKLTIVSLVSMIIVFAVFYADANFRSFVKRILRVVF